MWTGLRKRSKGWGSVPLASKCGRTQLPLGIKGQRKEGATRAVASGQLLTWAPVTIKVYGLGGWVPQPLFPSALRSLVGTSVGWISTGWTSLEAREQGRPVDAVHRWQPRGPWRGRRGLRADLEAKGRHCSGVLWKERWLIMRTLVWQLRKYSTEIVF